MYEIVIWQGTGREYTFNSQGVLIPCRNPGVGMIILFTNHNTDGSGICIYYLDDGKTYTANEAHHDLIERAAVNSYENILTTASMLAMDINNDTIRLFPAYPKDSHYISYIQVRRLNQKMNIVETLHQLQNARTIIQQASNAIQQTSTIIHDAADVLTRA